VAHLGRGSVGVEAKLGIGHVLIFEGEPDFPRLRK
jgi:hypothetical protein